MAGDSRLVVRHGQPGEGCSAIVLTDHLCNAGGTLPGLDFNADIVGDAQGIGRDILRLQDADTRSQARACGHRGEIANPVGAVIQGIFQSVR